MMSLIGDWVSPYVAHGHVVGLQVATNDLGERTNSTPAVSDGELFLRTHEHLYCIAVPAETSRPPASTR